MYFGGTPKGVYFADSHSAQYSNVCETHVWEFSEEINNQMRNMKFSQMETNSKHEKKFDDIKVQESAFKDFYDNAKKTFGKFQESDLSSHSFKDRCNFNVCPGSRNGGNNPDVVEMFWGSHPVKSINKKDGRHFLIEEGVTLFLYLLPSGYVSITLFPAKTEIMRPLEDNILLYRYKKATWLLKEKNQQSLWRDFMAYTEYTSLIGTPSIKQLLRILWLKFSRPLYVDGIQQPVRLMQVAQKIFSFAMTVGLSGFLLVAIQQCSKEGAADYSPLIEQTNLSVEGVKQIQGELLEETRSVNAGIDSLLKLTPFPQKK